MDGVHQCIQNTHIHNVFSAYGWFLFQPPPPLPVSRFLSTDQFVILGSVSGFIFDFSFLVTLSIFLGAREVSVKHSEKFLIVIIFNMYFADMLVLRLSAGRSVGRLFERATTQYVLIRIYPTKYGLEISLKCANTISNFCTAHNCNVEGSIMILSSSE